jgi:O-glycosyl hydrolase
VKTSCYGSWSDTIAAFAKKYGLYAMSIGNEPDFASCGNTEPCNGNYDTTLYTANEMVAFVKVAGPKLQANMVKVIAPEASEWIHAFSNESGCCSEPGKKQSSDPLKCGFPASNTACTKGDGYDYGHWLAKDADAWKAFDIMGVHEYDTQHAEPWPSDITAARKEVWQTEMSGVKYWPEQGPSTDIGNGVAVAGWIHSALVVGEASAWVYWQYKAYFTDDNEGLLLMNGGSTKRYYTVGNYSKFVRPDYVMVEVAGNSNASLLLSAFKGTDGTVIVAINKGTDASVPISFSGGTAPASCTPNVTSKTDSLKAGTAVAVTGGILTATLPGMSVTTFVCK